MDKTLLKAYIRTLVEEEVKKILPEMLSEAVQEIKQLKEHSTPRTLENKKTKLDRGRLAELMGISYDGDTLMATTSNVSPKTLTALDSAGNKIEVPTNQVDSTVVDAITRDYSQLMKAMKIV